MSKKITPQILALIALTAPMPAMADEISDTLKEVLSLYEAGEVGEAKELLDYASVLLAKQQAGNMRAVLPQTVGAFTLQAAGDSSDMQAGMAMLGGTVIGGEYHSDKADMLIEIISDSPMIAMAAAQFSSPAMMAQLGEVVRVGGEKALLNSDGELLMLFDNHILIQIDGSAAAEDKIALLKALDFDALEEF